MKHLGSPKKSLSKLLLSPSPCLLEPSPLSHSHNINEGGGSIDPSITSPTSPRMDKLTLLASKFGAEKSLRERDVQKAIRAEEMSNLRQTVKQRRAMERDGVTAYLKPYLNTHNAFLNTQNTHNSHL